MALLPQKAKGNGEASSAIPQAGRYAPSGAASEDLQAVLAVGRVLAGKLDHQDVLAGALGTAAEIIGAEGSSILLIDPETGAMSFHVASGPRAEAVKRVPLPPGAGICGHVARTGEPLIVNDAQHDERLYRRVDEASGFVTRNLLCVPLRTSERLWGVLELVNKQGRDGFDPHDLHPAEAMADQIALALANAHLHGRIVRQERMAAVGQTVSGLAHCIKNILNGIRSGSAVVDRAMGAGDLERLAEGWQVVRKNNEMLSNLVLDMLSLARESKYHPFPTDVNDLLEQLCRLMTERAAERGVDFSGQDMGEFLGTQPEAYVDKPIEPVVLRQTVTRLLKKSGAIE